MLKGKFISRFIRSLFIELVSVLMILWEQKFDKKMSPWNLRFDLLQLRADFEKGISLVAWTEWNSLV